MMEPFKDPRISKFKLIHDFHLHNDVPSLTQDSKCELPSCVLQSSALELIQSGQEKQDLPFRNYWILNFFPLHGDTNYFLSVELKR